MSQAAIDFLERETFHDPENQALLELHEPPESTSILPLNEVPFVR